MGSPKVSLPILMTLIAHLPTVNICKIFFYWIRGKSANHRHFYFLVPHSSLLSVFDLSATSTYDSYLPLIFGIFGLIWGHFWNVRKGRFRGHGGHRGQTTLKSKTTKILNQNLLKLDEIQILASATSKMTSWSQRPRKWLSEFFQKLHFLNQCIKLRKMSYSLTL